MNSLAPLLPVELQGEILKHLKPNWEDEDRTRGQWTLTRSRDFTNLINCSLVCNRWRDMVRPWLYHTFSIHPRAVTWQDGNVVYATNASYLQEMEEFLSQSLHLVTHVKRLHIYHLSAPPFKLCDVLRLFAGITTLHLYSRFYDMLYTTPHDLAFLSQLSHVRTLTLSGAAVMSFKDVVESFPNLASLTLHTVAQTDADVPFLDSNKIRRLALASLGTGPPRQWRTQSVECLTVEWISGIAPYPSTQFQPAVLCGDHRNVKFLALRVEGRIRDNDSLGT
jgi:hypothetical protein